MKVYITRQIPQSGIDLLESAGLEVIISQKSGVLSKQELINELINYNPDAVIPLLTDTIDADIFKAATNAKVFATYSVGYNHIDIDAAKVRGVTVTNTPGVLTSTVAEYAVSMICAITKRIPEANEFTKSGGYEGWAPMLLLGSDLKNKTLGVLGAGRIGSRVAEIMYKGFGMKVVYYDIKESSLLNNEVNAEYYSSVDEVLKVADVVTVHVPLLESTKHLINKERLAMMKATAYLINTSRGPVVDELALKEALEAGIIKGAALDVFEDEPSITPGLSELKNVILTPHIASATEETRSKMSAIAAQNVIAVLTGREAPNKVI
ncbi:MAG: D-glycerate dehydrogenase [Candidatus Pacebacteria bacterium]|nr:D-glycerate dehydrogenase [Candidatus Paceibacterota bacterium]